LGVLDNPQWLRIRGLGDEGLTGDALASSANGGRVFG
jgi:hypothetical protein